MKFLNLATTHHCDHMTSENPEKCQHSDNHRKRSLKWTFCVFWCFFWIQSKWNGKRLSVVGFSHDVALQRSLFWTLFVPPPPTAVTFELITHIHTVRAHTQTHSYFLWRDLDTTCQWKHDSPALTFTLSFHSLGQVFSFCWMFALTRQISAGCKATALVIMKQQPDSASCHHSVSLVTLKSWRVWTRLFIWTDCF